jgi:VCBS repeat-containing protein
MRTTDSLRLVGTSFCDLFISSRSKPRANNQRRRDAFSQGKGLRFEQLETRSLLSASGLDPWVEPAALAEGGGLANDTHYVANSQNDAPYLAAPLNDVIVDQSAPLILSTPGQTYQLQTSLRFTGNGIYIAAANVTLDLNGHTIYYGGQNTNTVNDHLKGAHGVVLYVNWHNTEISIPGATSPTNAIIKNGSIVHEGTGAVSHAIYGRDGLGATVRDIRAEANGKDTHSVYFYSGSFSLYDNVLISRASDSFNRHSGPANVHGVTVTAHNNVLIGGNSGFAVLGDSEIIGNVIAHDGHVTNGYGVWLYRASNVLVKDNLILPSNGRGVLLNAGDNIQVFDNVILHLEAPNAEFGESLNPPAIRSRYDTNGNTISGNTGLGIAGGDVGLTSASGLYLTEDGTGSSSFVNNNLTTILVGERNYTHYAQPVTFEGHGSQSQSQDIISNNVFRSNDSLIRVQGFDGGLVGQIPVVDNELAFVTGNTAKADFVAVAQAKLVEIGMDRNTAALGVVSDAIALINWLITEVPLYDQRTTWYLKYYGLTDVNGTFVDLGTGPGVDLAAYDYYTLNEGLVSVKVGQTVPVVLAGPGGELATSVVTVTTDLDDTYNYTTSGTGGFSVPVIEFALEKDYPTNSPVVKNQRKTTTITVSGYAPVTLDNSVLLSHKNDASPLMVVLIPLGETAPQASSDAYSTSEEAVLNVPASGVLGNDSDAQSNPLTAVLVTGPSHGTLQLNANGSFVYTPPANYQGSDSFTYRAHDGSEYSNIASVALMVTAVNDPPAGTNKTVSTQEDTPYVFTAADFGFSDPNDSPANSLLAVRIGSLPGAGGLTLNGVAVTLGQYISAANLSAGLLRFTPASQASGTSYASFTFQVQDNGGTANGGIDVDSTANTITFNVTAVNDPPAGTNKTVSTQADTSYTFTAADFGFSDPNDVPANSLLAVKITTLPTAGTLTNNGLALAAGQAIVLADLTAGKLKFTPASQASGTSYASFTFQVQDNGGTANGGVDLDPTPNTITVDVATAAGPIGFWRFDDLSGSIATDSSGSGNHGTLQGGASFGSGGLVLSAANQRVVVANSPSLEISNAITIAAWIAPTSKSTQSVVTKAIQGSVNGYELALSAGGNVFVRFNQASSGDTYRLDSTSSYPTNGSLWMHVAATYDGTTIRLYVNGQLQGTKVANISIVTNNVALGIGAEASGDRSMKGRLDDVLIANRALQINEVTDLYQGNFHTGVPQASSMAVEGIDVMAVPLIAPDAEVRSIHAKALLELQSAEAAALMSTELGRLTFALSSPAVDSAIGELMSLIASEQSAANLHSTIARHPSSVVDEVSDGQDRLLDPLQITKLRRRQFTGR